MTTEKMMIAGTVLIIVGFIIIFAAIMIQAYTSSKAGEKTEAGGVIFIGPIPIIWGSTKEMSKLMLAIGIIIASILSIIYIMNYMKTLRP